ncbi:MAG: GIY-YIG nuclease family protein [Candidatus Zixiibacteriota bacterium]
MKAEKDFNPPCWRLYILRCSGGSFYTGITTDIAKRIKVHNSGKGAKYTGRRTPVELVYFEDCESETRARRRELELKGWRRDKKEALIHGFPSSVLRDFLRISGQ